MKFLHISDLHLGKRVNEFPMMEDQKYILEQILSIAEKEQTDAVIIAGDIYDKPVPPAEAVQVFDWFLTALAGQKRQVFVVSGNHDSAERLAFGAQLMRGRGVYVSPVYDGEIAKIPLADEHGALFVYLLPFIKPVTVRHALKEKGVGVPDGGSEEGLLRHAQKKGVSVPDGGCEEGTVYHAPTEDAGESTLTSYQDAVEYVISRMDVDQGQRNLLVAHQFVTGAGRCESEETVVGGLDNVDAEVFDAFDYVALGHIHSPQSVGRKNVRYCGTPLKYSFSEAEQIKSVTIVEMEEKGKTEFHTVPLRPLHDMRVLRGTYLEVTAKSFYQDMDTQDYVKIILTDEEDIPDGVQKLRVIYPNLMRLEYDNKRTRQNRTIEAAKDMEEKSELELFEEFYELQNNQPMSAEQREYITCLLGEIQGEIR